MTKLIVTFRQEGYHYWPEAPPHRAYLGQAHRHLFHFRVELTVPEELPDRVVEFHDFQERAKRMVTMWPPHRKFSQDSVTIHSLRARDFGPDSCETIAGTVARRLVEEYSLDVAVECWEDGEVGARVEEMFKESDRRLQ